MNGLHSRFSSSSPAPNKGDFFFTSRFERLGLDTCPLNHGSQKVIDAGYDSTRENLKVERNRVASEIFSDLHLVLKYNDLRPSRMPMILGSACGHTVLK